ncbi:MAG: aldo/keto reductase [Spirochaeta sp.]|nr:aldo/keto reductase [Spirochaeta sp.]
MNNILLGRTGLKVSELCLGTMTFGRETTEKDSFAILDAFVEAGGNFIDTADVYSTGISERVLGKWLRGKRREDFIIATKVRYPMGKGVNETGLSRKHIMDGVAASLERLNTEYIDLYQIHGWDPLTRLETTLGTLSDLVHHGKVRYVGASNMLGSQLQKAIDVAVAAGLEPFMTLQPQYNLLARGTEWELLHVAREEGLGVLPWSPLAGGWLSGKYFRGMEAPPEGSRIARGERNGSMERWSRRNTEHTWGVLDALFAVSKETGKTPAQVAVNWLLCKDVVSSPIIGARTMDHLLNYLGACEFRLSSEQMAQLDSASDPDFGYPYDADAEYMRVRD